MRPAHHVDRPDGTERRVVVDLRDDAALSADVAGAKALNLARATRAGLPVLPGFVVTTAATPDLDDASVERALVAAWSALSRDGSTVVVRSSSTVEDAGVSSMAGRFTSVLDVRGVDELLAAIRRVVDSAANVGIHEGGARPIAVLVQPQVDAHLGGVMFGVDPVTGRTDRIVVEVVRSAPDSLVGGRVCADHIVLTRRGRQVAHAVGATSEPIRLEAPLRHRLVELSARAASVFGGPQDIEWAVDVAGTLWLLQSRPVTASAAPPSQRRGRGPVLGPGPLAETFPRPLTPLEDDLWLTPMREGMRRALVATGAARRATIERSPIVTSVRGRPAVDLTLIGAVVTSTGWQRLMPSSLVRRLRMAWRIGRLRVALPSLATTVIDAVDDDLRRIGMLSGRSEEELLDLLHTCRSELATVHAYEMLCGMLEHDRSGIRRTPLPVVAMHELQRGRDDGLDDDEIIERHPVVLALTVPAVVLHLGLPALVIPPVAGGRAQSTTAAISDERASMTMRDELRLRSRWLQELGTRAALELGRRAHTQGVLAVPDDVRWFRLAELDGLDAGRAEAVDLGRRARSIDSSPLPERFVLHDEVAVPVRRSLHAPFRRRAGSTVRGLPASSGRAAGTVVHCVGGDSDPVIDDAVLVTDHLDPQLATALPSLVGLVAETGSALSHLAILAREARLPTVVGVTDARARLPRGARVVVDGGTGEVELIETASASPRGGA